MEKQPFQNKLLSIAKDLQGYMNEQEVALGKAMASIDDPQKKAILAEATKYAKEGNIQKVKELMSKLNAS